MDVVVRPDGKAVFYESLDWQASGGQMHGFYFEGAAVQPVFNLDQCYADLAGNVRVGARASRTWAAASTTSCWQTAARSRATRCIS